MVGLIMDHTSLVKQIRTAINDLYHDDAISIEKARECFKAIQGDVEDCINSLDADIQASQE